MPVKDCNLCIVYVLLIKNTLCPMLQLGKMERTVHMRVRSYYCCFGAQFCVRVNTAILVPHVHPVAS